MFDYKQHVGEHNLYPAYRGIKMQQNAGVFDPLAQLIVELKPTVIVEIGTGRGGLTLFLNDVRDASTKLVSYDNSDERVVDMTKARLDFRVRDVFDQATMREIAEFISKGHPCLLLCDGGDKAREVNTFSTLLKPGDVIMAHDYAHLKTQQVTIRKDRSHRCEVWYEQIQQTVEGLGMIPLHADEFAQVAWACFRMP